MIVAEIASSHNGSLDRAIKLIEMAAVSGADAVKLQTYTPGSMTIDHDGPGFTIHSGQWANKKLHDLYTEAATPLEWHPRLFAEAHNYGIMCFSSPFDMNAVQFLEDLDCPVYKIASFEITDTNLIRRAAFTGKPVIISTGMASDEEIMAALNVCEEPETPTQTVLLHCVSAYPTPPEKANLQRITHLKRQFGRSVGLSDHSLSTAAIPVTAIGLGAEMIEKHLTLSRSDGGLDAAHSLEPEEFYSMVQNIREARAALQHDDSGTTEPYKHLRRSLYVVKDVQKGDVFTDENVRSIRPGYGLSPGLLPKVLGCRAASNISRGTPLSLELVA